ncbi:MAG: GIY-YIG nuclease family protein, partial [Armatimonadetes bacterium]|nr:GIY-YIG nuclease family protein [Armatimonadota bacterium]
MAEEPTVIARDDVATLPRSPGVYFFYNRAGRLLYIGKAARLRERVASYFRPRSERGRRRQMAQRVRRIGYLLCACDLEARIVEARLIQHHQPPHNVLSRVPMNHAFLRVDFGEAYPRVDVVRELTADGARYYGPFRGSTAAERVTTALSRGACLRTCSGPLRPRADHPGCLAGHLGQCLRPCDLTVDEAAYRAAAEDALALLRDLPDGLAARLTAAREQASAELRFEDAAALHEALVDLHRAVDRPLVSGLPLDRQNLAVLQPLGAGRWEVVLVAGGRYAGRALAGEERPVLEAAFGASREGRSAAAEVPQPAFLRRGAAADSAPTPAAVLDELRIVAA